MKKHSKVFKALTLLLCLIICGVGVRMDVVAANTTLTTEYGCGKTLCFKDIMISGPYGNPDEIINSSVPYVGGMKYKDAYQLPYVNTSDGYQNEHMYVIYCPKYDNSDSSLLSHTMVLMCADHGFTTKSYTQYSSVYHYANKICDYAPDLRDDSSIRSFYQGLSGENAYLSDEDLYAIAEKYQSTTGCGVETSVLEGHTWTYGDWYSAGGSNHSRTATCIYCGYSKKVSDNHSLSTTDWEKSSESEHKRTTSCSVCDYSNIEYANHQFTYGSWGNSSDAQHKRTATCSTCGYSTTEYANHNLTTSQPLTYGTEDENDSTYPHGDYHKYEITCSDCNYTNLKYEPHEMFIYVDWYDYDDIDHKKMTRCSICAYGVSYYRHHQYPTELYTYESVDDASHQITKHCDTCSHTVDGGTANHNYVAGEWYKYGTENSYDDEYDHMKYHQRESVCSDCGNVKIEHAEHDWYWVTESWNYSSEERHTRTKRCKDCDYGWGYTDYHHFTTDPYYEQYSDDEHTKINPCDECEYEKETLEAHSFTASTVYTQFSETQHQVTQSCICGEKHISYADHIDQNSDCYCDKCGYLMTKFSVTVPTTMVLTMGIDGEVYAPSDVVIINNSTAAVSVKKADINSRNGWNIVPYSTNMANEKVDSKKIGFKMNGIQTDSAGTTDSLSYNNSWIIEKDTSSSVVYNAVVSATSSPIDEQVIEIVYIVDWKE